MLNKDLLDNADIEQLIRKISVLEKQIADFKEYDERRKQYYNDIVQRCHELEIYVAELEDTDSHAETIKSLKATVASLNRTIRVNKLRTDIPEEEADRLIQADDIKRLRQTVSKQKKTIKQLNEAQSHLISRLCQMERANTSGMDGETDDSCQSSADKTNEEATKPQDNSRISLLSRLFH